jgi:hypothetical protein
MLHETVVQVRDEGIVGTGLGEGRGQSKRVQVHPPFTMGQSNNRFASHELRKLIDKLVWG